MSFNPTTIASFDVYPSSVIPTPMWIGDAKPRRALDGTGRRKNVAQKLAVALAFDSCTSDVVAIMRVIWEQGRQGSVTLVDTNQSINSTFLVADQSFNFKPMEGPSQLWSGSMTFEEV